jgi:hypothetical protein
MGLELGGMGLWTYSAEPPEEPYAYILDDKGISTIQKSVTSGC